MIKYHDPVAPRQIENLPYKHRISIAGANEVHIGFLANGFPDSENFLVALQEAMQVLEPGINVHAYNKGNASIPAPADMLSEITGDCQAVVAAYGHWGSCTTGTVRDGVNIATLGKPAVALVTEEFWAQGDFVAASLGMPDVPRVRLPHPIAGTGKANMKSIAAQVAPLVIKALEGKPQ